MARKGKKKDRRQKKARDVSAGQEAPAAEESVAPSAPPPKAAERRPAREKRKARPRKAGHVRVAGVDIPVRTLVGWGAIGGVIGAVALVVVLIATSGSSGVSAPRPTAEPDPRVAGLTPVETLRIDAGGSDFDAYFDPRTLTGPAGEPIEIVITNVGSLSHNLTIAGVDGQYDTDDDWVSDPVLITPGEEGSVVVKIDEPGTYVFRCSLHPQVQTGELVLQ